MSDPWALPDLNWDGFSSCIFKGIRTLFAPFLLMNEYHLKKIDVVDVSPRSTLLVIPFSEWPKACLASQGPI